MEAKFKYMATTPRSQQWNAKTMSEIFQERKEKSNEEEEREKQEKRRNDFRRNINRLLESREK